MDTETKEPARPAVKVSAYVESSLAARLAAQAFHNDRSIAAEVRVALRDYLRKENDQ